MFPATRWSLVAAAKDATSPGARKALAELCQTYWYPLYFYIRRHGHGHEAAQDLTQEFITRLLEKDGFASAEPGRGRFRSFLLAACKNFLANDYHRATAVKRGGGRPLLSLDFSDAEGRYGHEPAHALTPERLFDRRWALAVLDAVLIQLRREYESAGKGELFDRLKGHLTGEGGRPYAEESVALGMREGAVRVAAHRLRLRYRELLRDEIGQTLADPAEVDGEIRALFAALAP